jgi:hypothetical protein
MPARRSVGLLVSSVLALSTAVVVATAPAADAATRRGAVSAGATYARTHGYYVGVAVLDTKTGHFYGAGHYKNFFASESVVKVFIATRLLVSGRMHGTTKARAYKMITQSDDAIASSFYGSVGGDSLINWIKQRYGVPSLGTPPHRANWWGNTHITPGGLVRLYAKLKRDPKVGPWLLNAMHHATRFGSDGTFQFFGLPSATSGAAIKQGWGADFDDWFNSADFNTTGFVNHDRYAVAILARGPISTYGSAIGNLLTNVARRVLPAGVFPDPVPTLTGISRAVGPLAGGTRVMLRGTNFTHVQRVLFSTTPGTTVKVLSPGRLLVTTPKHAAKTVSIRVVTDHGTSAATGAPRFSFRPAPRLTALAPTTGSTAGGQLVTITGSNFTDVSKVSFGGVAARFSVVSPTQLHAVTPPSQTARRVVVRVVTEHGYVASDASHSFRYTAPAPAVKRISPRTRSSAGGKPIAVHGTGFTRSTRVSFGGQPATRVVYYSPRLVVATVPAHAPGRVAVRVSTANGSVAAGWFRFG